LPLSTRAQLHFFLLHAYFPRKEGAC
jgi:hypothetical protein